MANASVFRTTKKSQLSVYRCRTVSHLSTNTIFQQCHLAPPQVVLFLREVLKGEASITLAAELSVSPQTILNLRRDDDGDGIREVHCNTVEDMWTDVRNFLRPGERRSQETPGWLRGDL